MSIMLTWRLRQEDYSLNQPELQEPNPSKKKKTEKEKKKAKEETLDSKLKSFAVYIDNDEFCVSSTSLGPGAWGLGCVCKCH